MTMGCKYGAKPTAPASPLAAGRCGEVLNGYHDNGYGTEPPLPAGLIVYL
jgi:hypothetical protein